MFCSKCGSELKSNAKFCMHCGARLVLNDMNIPDSGSNGQGSRDAQDAAAAIHASAVKIRDQISSKIADVTGDDRKSDLKLSDLFVNVPARHPREERENIFICGTKTTTPPEYDMTSGWQKPFLYSRIFLFFAITFIMLWFSAGELDNIISYPGLMIMGSFAMPVTIMVLFFELNVPRNISFFDALTTFFIGGVMSIASALIIFQITDLGGNLDYGGAIAVGIIEELAKLLVVAVFIFRVKKCKFILNGLLIGAAVGAGFAAFESAGYSFVAFISTGDLGRCIESIVLRGILSPGGHVGWAAIEGGALMLLAGDKGFSWDYFKNPRLLILLLVPMVLHSIWDMPLLDEFMDGYFKLILLTVISWIFLIHLIKAGLSQITRVESGGPLLKE